LNSQYLLTEPLLLPTFRLFIYIELRSEDRDLSFSQASASLIICCKNNITNGLAISEPGFTPLIHKFIWFNLIAKLGSMVNAFSMSNLSISLISCGCKKFTPKKSS
ncbi:hypothetical protein, partial [Anabaena sp. PCC 7938]|uniref:hypothetical protein n=1 Tax=Anabaena sp. PCC 7938 TaxID=1296340 RepID=UPI0020346748